MDDSNFKDNNILGLEGPKADSLAERKARIKREGDFFRVGIVRAKAHIAHGAKPETLFHSALDHATFALRSRVDSILRPTGINVATIAPYAMTVLGLLRRRGLMKPALAILAVAGGAAVYVQQRRTRSS